MEQLNLQLGLDNDDPLVQLLTPRDILSRITRGELSRFKEDRRVEFKQNLIHFDDLVKYYSMFSNTAPDGGIILIGVDKSGSPSGCATLSPGQVNRLESFHIQYCPAAKPEHTRIPCTVNGLPNFITAIYVPYLNRLCETNKGEAFIRYGDSIHKMSDEEKRDFRITRNEIPFEVEPCGLSYPNDFDADIINALCSKYRQYVDISDRSDDEILELRNLGQIRLGSFFPNKALALLAAKNPRQLFPGCRVRIQRFESTTEGQGETYRPIIDRFIEGNIVNIVQRASAVLDTIIYDYTWLNDDGKFVNVKEYPRSAWFEALVNACVHRSYVFSGMDTTIKLFEDRMVIESPGGFCPPVNVTNVYDVRASRNPHLIDAMFYLDYVKMAREGTRRMRHSMASFGLPEPVFEQETIHGLMVRVVLQNNGEYRRRAIPTEVMNLYSVDDWRTLSEEQQKIIEYAARNARINISEAQRCTGRTWETAKKRLLDLTKRGYLIYQAGSYKQDPAAHFRIPPPGIGRRRNGKS